MFDILLFVGSQLECLHFLIYRSAQLGSDLKKKKKYINMYKINLRESNDDGHLNETNWRVTSVHNNII